MKGEGAGLLHFRRKRSRISVSLSYKDQCNNRKVDGVWCRSCFHRHSTVIFYSLRPDPLDRSSTMSLGPLFTFHELKLRVDNLLVHRIRLSPYYLDVTYFAVAHKDCLRA